MNTLFGTTSCNTHDFAKWLSMTWNHILGKDRAFDIKKQIVVHPQWFFLRYSWVFSGSYTKDEPNFPWQNNVILKKKVSSVDKFVNFKDFSRP